MYHNNNTKDIKKSMMKKISYDFLLTLLEDEEDEKIQEQALLMIRSLLYKTPDDVEEVFTNCKAKLLKKLEEKLTPDNGVEILTQVLYILCNISSSNDKHKSVVFDFIPAITSYLDSGVSNIRQPCILILHNLINFTEFEKKVNPTWNDILTKLEKLNSDEDFEIEYKAYTLGIISKLKNLKK
jgi:hypothetical protein